ncbi:hypothetical protein GCM10009736_31070 [Actinomadura bangladeshensis]
MSSQFGVPSGTLPVTRVIRLTLLHAGNTGPGAAPPHAAILILARRAPFTHAFRTESAWPGPDRPPAPTRRHPMDELRSATVLQPPPAAIQWTSSARRFTYNGQMVQLPN